MRLAEKVDFYGVFSIKSIGKNNEVLDEYVEKNLIMDVARANMAAVIAGVSSGEVISRFVLGTRGHVSTNILDFQQVGSIDSTKPEGNQTFDSTRTQIFSTSIPSAVNYRIDFTHGSSLDETGTFDGQRYEENTAVGDIETNNEVRRVVSDRTVSYTFTIPATNANSGDIDNPIVAYTEAGLYAGDNIFSMKTFPARVKEDTVRFEITWSIIF